jgi:sugar lactone lactonase YvrE
MVPRSTTVRSVLVLLVLVLAAMVAWPAGAGASGFPETIPLPQGWRPEGITSDGRTTLYVGSIPTGAIWKADARTGEGRELVAPQEGRSAIGIELDRRGRIFVAGGATGSAFVYDARSGADLASYRLAPADAPATFVNDLVVTDRAAWFTDSRLQQLYAVPLGRHGGLPGQDAVRTLPLTGDLQYTEDLTDVDLNGIVAARDGRVLLSVQSSTGKLFRINPRSGVTREVDLGGATLDNGDGLLLAGRVLFVVQNRLNQIAVVVLSESLRSGRVVATITDPDFRVPTTITFAAGTLYAVNARFGIEDPDTADYEIVRVG